MLAILLTFNLRIPPSWVSDLAPSQDTFVATLFEAHRERLGLFESCPQHTARNVPWRCWWPIFDKPHRVLVVAFFILCMSAKAEQA